MEKSSIYSFHKIYGANGEGRGEEMREGGSVVHIFLMIWLNTESDIIMSTLEDNLL